MFDMLLIINRWLKVHILGSGHIGSNSCNQMFPSCVSLGKWLHLAEPQAIWSVEWRWQWYGLWSSCGSDMRILAQDLSRPQCVPSARWISFPSLATPEPQGRWMSGLEWMKEQGSENIKLEECNGFCIKPESIVASFESLLQNSKRKLRPVVLNWSLFCTQGTFISDWRYFQCHN